jgi:dienelactone hydrolase
MIRRGRIGALAGTLAIGVGAIVGAGAGAGAFGQRAHSAAAASVQRVDVPNGNLKLPALVARPAGNHRFPAVVLLHGCGGLWSKTDRTQPQRHLKRWLEQLQARGYVAIAVDGFRPRGVKAVCGRDPSRTGVNEVTDRATDAFAALSYLRSLSYVSPQRIAVLGWSNGGSTALATVAAKAPVAPPTAGGFRAAVAFYPGCGLRNAFKTYRPTVPTRVLAAARDPLASRCKSRARRAGKRFGLTVYRGAHHSFDETSFHNAFDKAARKRGDAAALATITSALASQVNTRTIFDPDSWITAPLTPSAPLDPDQSLAAALRSQITEFGTWVNTTEWSSPLYVVPADQPRVKVNIDAAHSRYGPRDIGYMAAEFESVPLPPDAQSAGPQESLLVPWVDHELIVYQPATDTAWEFYHLVKDANGWSATGGGRITGVSHSNGDYDPWPSATPHGMTGSGIPMFAGLQRLEELRRGTIDHVVGVSIPHVKKDVFRSPATRSDGEWTTPDAVPEGTRFRLPPDLNIDALPLTPYAKMVAKAIQAHGLVIVDRDCRPSDRKRCPAVTFKAEDPRPRKPDPYLGIFGGVAPNHLFDNFPWDRLQVLAED